MPERPPAPPDGRPAPPARLVPRPRFRADIEGLRAVAVLLVVLYHAGVPGFGGGYVGVDVFFVLSGYLITWLLVHEVEETGTVRLGRFYARRARRLFPAIAVVLVATVAASAVALAPFEQRTVATTALATALYVSNVLFADRATDYLGGVEHDPLLHTWSLAVEEQFYLVWPVLVLLALGAGWRRAARPSRGRLVAWLGVVALGSFALCVVVTGSRQPWAFFLSPTRAWEFAVGALAVLARADLRVAGGHVTGAAARRLNPGRVGAVEHALGWAGLAALLVVGAMYGAETPFPGAAALVPVLATALVLRAGTARTETALARLLAWRPLQTLGRLSYSWYLWHWPVLVLGGAAGLGGSLPARLALVAAALGLAAASYRFVEDPLRHHPALAGRAGRSLAVAAALTVFGAGLSIAWGAAAAEWASSPGQARWTALHDETPQHYRDGCVGGLTDPAVRECAYGPDSAGATVVLFGDSHAGQWFPAVERAAARQGWRLVVIQKSSCPAADVVVRNGALGRRYTECEAWREAALDRIAALRPALVLTSSENVHPVAPEAWAAGAGRTFRRLAASAGRVVHVEDTPRPGFDAAACLARRAWRPGGGAACTFPAPGADRQRLAALERAEAEAAGVAFVSWNDALCPTAPCRVVDGERPVYRDGHHVSVAYAERFAPRAKALLDRPAR